MAPVSSSAESAEANRAARATSVALTQRSHHRDRRRTGLGGQGAWASALTSATCTGVNTRRRQPSSAWSLSGGSVS